MGASSQRDGVSIQRQVHERYVVMGSEIQNLPNLTGYLKLPAEPVRRVQYTWKRRTKRAEGFVRSEKAKQGAAS